MTIEEITKLRIQDEAGTLRMPKGSLAVQNNNSLREVNDAVEYLAIANMH